MFRAWLRKGCSGLPNRSSGTRAFVEACLASPSGKDSRAQRRMLIIGFSIRLEMSHVAKPAERGLTMHGGKSGDHNKAVNLGR